MRIEGILFDKDGTLFEFEATWVAWSNALIARLSDGDAARAAALAEAIGFDIAGQAFRPDSPAIAGTPDELARALAPILREPAARVVQRLNAASMAAPVIEAVPLAPLLDRLSAGGLVLGVATNDAEAPARAHLAAAGVVDRFAFIAGCDSGHGAKPAPGQCLAFARATGLAPARVAMVGDSRHDLAAGRAAGMHTVAVLTGPARDEDLRPFADVVLPDIGHLPEWLAS
jgi:phosphoglycolate phosphatase